MADDPSTNPTPAASPSTQPGNDPAPAGDTPGIGPTGTQAGDPAATPPAGTPPAASPPPAGDASSWRDAISDKSLLDAQVMSGLDSPDQVAHKLIELDAKLKADNRVTPPGENASEEEIAAYREAIGVPKEATPEAYGFKADAIDPESGLEFNEQMSQWAAESFHKHGIPAEAAKGIFDDWNRMQAEQMSAYNTQIDQMEQQTNQMLDQRFGQTRPQAQKEIQQVVREIAGDHAGELEKMLMDRAAGSNPSVMGFLANLRDFYQEAKGEEAFKRPTGGPTSLGVTPAEARAQANALTADKNGPYWNKEHPQHKETVEKVNRLYEAMNPPVGEE